MQALIIANNPYKVSFKGFDCIAEGMVCRCDGPRGQDKSDNGGNESFEGVADYLA
jgi:hypothetical protein